MYGDILIKQDGFLKGTLLCPHFGTKETNLGILKDIIPIEKFPSGIYE